MTFSKLGVEVLAQLVWFLKSSVGINSLAEFLSVFPHMNNRGLVNVEQLQQCMWYRYL